MFQCRKGRINAFLAGLAVALLGGTAAIAQTDASNPAIQQAKSIPLKGDGFAGDHNGR
jgi:hypothetical protein